MAKRKASGGKKKAKPTRKAAASRGSAKRPSKVKTSKRKPAARARRKAAPKRAQKARKAAAPRRPSARRPKAPAPAGKAPRLDRARRTLDETSYTPPSSLDMNRHGSAARTGRAEIAEREHEHGEMIAVTGGDVDVNIEQAYFAGDEAPGGDNPTPDMDIVDDIGKAIGVEYQDNEELRASDKVTARDKHRWELDPASAEDYKERK